MRAIFRWTKRILAIAFLALLLFFFGGGVFKGLTTPDLPPTVQQAPWTVQTSSRVYYAKDFSVQAGQPAIRDFWTFDGKHYRFTKGVMPFPQSLFGDVKVYQRAQTQ